MLSWQKNSSLFLHEKKIWQCCVRILRFAKNYQNEYKNSNIFKKIRIPGFNSFLFLLFKNKTLNIFYVIYLFSWQNTLVLCINLRAQLKYKKHNKTTFRDSLEVRLFENWAAFGAVISRLVSSRKPYMKNSSLPRKLDDVPSI